MLMRVLFTPCPLHPQKELTAIASHVDSVVSHFTSDGLTVSVR